MLNDKLKIKNLIVWLLISLLAMTINGADFTNSTSGMSSVIPTPREKFQFSKEAFNAEFLLIDCRIQAKYPVQGKVFIKDKDGNFFQSDSTWNFDGDGKWQTLKVPIDKRNKFWRSLTNKERWNAKLAAGIFEAGVSFWGENIQTITCEVKNLRYEGIRKEMPLAITTLAPPTNAKVGKLLATKFQLSREYFNPFDPEEIAVDCEWIAPDGKRSLFPGFFTSDFQFDYRLTQEHAMAVGSPFWEVRYLPTIAGEHRFRIIARDKDGVVESPWETLTIADGEFSGVIQVSKQNPAFFAYENGTPFLPIGLNIHTNTDFRAETRLNLAPLSDRGLKDFEDYFAKSSAAGINCIEIWMASWTFALEWSSRRHNYYGIGRYNLANAARLDKLFELAEQYGILINLVIDNHGKFSDRPTQEWFENPYNKNSNYADSDGGFLTSDDDFFASEEYKKFYRQQNRYIAARYGQNPNIFAIELWSEVNLTIKFTEKGYPDGTCEKWHAEMIRDFQNYTPLRHLITTHVSGDIDTNNRWIRLWEIPEVSHLAGDAYRAEHIPMITQMRKQYNNIDFAKPCLITEFGGSSAGNDNRKLEADIHAGLWSAIFKKQAGLPFLWWHDFVILGDRLHHYKAVSKFLAGVDVSNPAYERRECLVNASPEEFLNPPTLGNRPATPWERAFGAMVLMQKNELIGWAFNNERLFLWHGTNPDLTAETYWREVELTLPLEFEAGKWQIEFFDTLTGEMIQSEIRKLNRNLVLPDFENDIAFKLRRIE